MTVAQAAEHFGQPDFDVFRGAMKKGLIVKLAPLLPGLQPRPKVDKHKCVACGICQEACPVAEKAVHSGHGQKANTTTASASAAIAVRKCARRRPFPSTAVP